MHEPGGVLGSFVLHLNFKSIRHALRVLASSFQAAAFLNGIVKLFFSRPSLRTTNGPHSQPHMFTRKHGRAALLRNPDDRTCPHDVGKG